ncbi:hypothetical protein QBC32DRAFT_388814 [Pseudoneurospora amorphoporcata]|uniref:DUF6536 domain-containing protein n=1 Tax=Pseudoneurospora amorphoporcata TaxID=241081 RepID=A0AAN6SGQ8_9PEZI|nr:hypothetical protein QBC32DRAFT_388814 [Pseudoneurospora amorphoporcata]
MESIMEGTAPSNSSSQVVRNQHSFIQERRRRRSLIRWPFQSIATDASSLFSFTGLSGRLPTRATKATRTKRTGTVSSAGGGGGGGSGPERPPFARRATWDPRRIREEDVESVNQDLIPDYVINYLRGETPEMVARRKRNGGKLGERAVDMTHQHQPHESRAGILENVLSETSSERLGFWEDGGVTGGDDERRYILPGTGSRWKRWSGAMTAGSGSRRWKRWTAGWRAGVGLNAFLAGVILLVGTICFVILAAWKGKDVFKGRIVIYDGSCSTIEAIDWGVHAVINIFGVILLAGANYTFQILSSPTREEVTAAHKRKKWLDIGIPSFRNLGYVAKNRSLLAIVVLLTAILTQVISNSIIFTSGPAPLTQTITADTPQPTCQLNVYGSLLGITVLLNLFTVLTLTSVLIFFKRGPSFTPLITLGDAITSFLNDPDPITRGACLLLKNDVKQGNWASGASQPKHWVPKRHYWFQAPSLPRWIITGLVCAICAGATAACLAFSIKHDGKGLSPFGNNHLTFSSQDSLAEKEPLITLNLEPTATQITVPAWAATIISSLPHLLLSALYLALNPLLTTYFLSHESSLFYSSLHHVHGPDAAKLQPQPLRVSSSALDLDPDSSQTTSLYLTLPRPVSWFLLAVFSAMGFVMSHSFGVFDVAASSEDVTGEGAEAAKTALFTSGVGLTTLLALLVLLFVFTVVLGFRTSTTPQSSTAPTTTTPSVKLTPASGVTEAPPIENMVLLGNPMALPGGSCSAVISARCHFVPNGEKGKGRRRSVVFSGVPDAAGADTTEIWKKPLVWGVVEEGAGHNEEATAAAVGIGHCGFTFAGRVGIVTEGRAYA